MSTLVSRVWRMVGVRGHVTIGRGSHVGFGSRVWAPSSLQIGEDVYIGRYCTIECDGTIGRGALIANNVGIVGRRDHDFRQVGIPLVRSSWVGSRPTTQQDAVHIGPDVWIGFGAVVLSGVTVGRGAIIGAGAIVANDVAPYAIVAGDPATVIGQRFTPEEIERHERALGPEWDAS